MVVVSGVARRRAVFLDRDGVLVVPEVRGGRSFAPQRLEDLHLYPEAKAALDRLQDSGYLLVVVTNQPDVGKGLISRSTMDEMHKRLLQELPIDRIEVCCHIQTEGCTCRKPKPGMLFKAAYECGIDLKNSFMVGDELAMLKPDLQLAAQRFSSTWTIQARKSRNPFLIVLVQFPKRRILFFI